MPLFEVWGGVFENKTTPTTKATTTIKPSARPSRFKASRPGEGAGQTSTVTSSPIAEVKDVLHGHFLLCKCKVSCAHARFFVLSRALSCKVFSANLQEFSRIMVARVGNHPISPGRRIEGTYSPVRCPKPTSIIPDRLARNRNSQ